MKKAEAISILATSVRPREAKDRERYDKAVNMAIEALKAQELKNVPDTNVGDMISRADAIDALSTPHGILYPIRTIKALPSVQPDIIVCADCKHWVCHDRRCGYWNHGVKPLEWCCHGERRTDG